MSRLVKLALIQQHATQDIQDNLNRAITAFEKAAEQGAKLIAFAELAFTPFYPQHPAQGDLLALAETIPGPTTNIFKELAEKYGVVTVLNLFETCDGKTFDSSPVLDADGQLLGTTRMVHIIEADCFHEQGYYAPGDGKSLVFDTAVGRVGVSICYDRHFPEYMRQLGLLGAEIVVIPQAGTVGEWPEGIYEAELQVAGFQNGYFTALCNRVGVETRLTFEGKSLVTAPDGQIIAQAPAFEDTILHAEIDLDQVREAHARRHFLHDRRPNLYSTWMG